MHNNLGEKIAFMNECLEGAGLPTHLRDMINELVFLEAEPSVARPPAVAAREAGLLADAVAQAAAYKGLPANLIEAGAIMKLTTGEPVGVACFTDEKQILPAPLGSLQRLNSSNFTPDRSARDLSSIRARDVGVMTRLAAVLDDLGRTLQGYWDARFKRA